MTQNEKKLIKKLLSRANELQELKDIPVATKQRKSKKPKTSEKRVSFVDTKEQRIQPRVTEKKSKKVKQTTELKKTPQQWDMYFNELNRIKNEKLHLLEDLLRQRDQARSKLVGSNNLKNQTESQSNAKVTKAMVDEIARLRNRRLKKKPNPKSKSRDFKVEVSSGIK